MPKELKLSTGREWKPYVPRHSLATLVRNRGAERWDLAGFMGLPRLEPDRDLRNRRVAQQHALTTLIEEIERASPGPVHRNHTGSRSPLSAARQIKMPV